MSELTESLRRRYHNCVEWYGMEITCLSEAADALEAQEARIKELETALERLLDDVLDIRGIDIEDYKPEAVSIARKALSIPKPI